MTPELLTVGLALALAASSAPVEHIIQVPHVPARPVLLDGQLRADEWGDATEVTIARGARLRLKQSQGHVYLAVQVEGATPRPVDLYLLTEDGALHQLHASMSIGERKLEGSTWTDMSPPWRWGNHVDWMANEAKQDSLKPSSLPFSARLFPADGVEFQIRRARFPGKRWRVLVEVNQFPGTEGSFVFPSGADKKSPAGWAVLHLDAPGEG